MLNLLLNFKTKNRTTKSPHPEFLYYPGVSVPHIHISAFIICIDTVILGLKDETIMRVALDEIQLFRKWLLKHGVREIQLNRL